MKNKGLLIIVCGPSGVGKGTICKKISKKNSNVHISVSATTRDPRPGEVDGENYFFLSKEQFKQMIDNDEFIEWAEYCNNYYGTPRKKVFEMIDSGKDVILEIDVQGAMQIRKILSKGIYIFMIPPSLDELKKRIINRGTENYSTIYKRLETAKKEYEFIKYCNYIILNDKVDEAVEKLESIIKAEKCRKEYILENLKGDPYNDFSFN